MHTQTKSTHSPLTLSTSHSPQRITKAFLSVLLLITSFLPQITLAASTGISAECFDTVAGYSTQCRASNVTPNEEITFKVDKPDGSVVRFPCTADANGTASCSLNKFHTKQAGNYDVAAYLSWMKEPDFLPASAFQVIDDMTPLSFTYDFQSSAQNIAADGQSSATLTVRVTDSRGQPVKNKIIEVVSSRPGDSVSSTDSGITDKNGMTTFTASSTTPGKSIFLARDVTANTVLADRIEVTFTPTKKTANAFLKAALNDSIGGGTATSLKITAPDTAKVGEAFDVTVCAVDATGAAAESYRGTVFFVVLGDGNATVPFANEGYTFAGTDPQGCHTFAKAVTFAKSGSIKLTVTDIDVVDIVGEKNITVIEKTGSVSTLPTATPGGSVSIISPSNGSTFGNTSVTVIGKGPQNSKINVYDGTVLLGNVTTDDQGNFSYAAKNLTEGKHSMIAEAFNASGTSLGRSTESVIYVATKGATLNDITISPAESVSPNTPLTLTILSDPKLSRVRVVIDGLAHDLKEDGVTPGKYTGTFAAPGKAGSYDIKVGLTNSLGNESNPSVSKKLAVVTQAETLKIQAAPGSTPGSIKLTWTGPQDSSNIKSYHVFFGENPLDLGQDQVIPNKGVSAEITQLKGATTYYFAIAPVGINDEEGNLSDIVSAKTADGVVTIDNVKAVSGNGKITLSWSDPDIDVNHYVIAYGKNKTAPDAKITTTSDATTWFVPNLATNTEYFFVITAVDGNNKALARSAMITGKTLGTEFTCQRLDIENLQVLYENDQPILKWDALPGAKAYRVYAGTQPGNYDLRYHDVTDTTYAVTGMDPNIQEYYFAVKALGDGDCFQGAVTSSAIKVKVGPALALVIFLVTAVTSLWFVRKRKMERIV